MAASTGHFEKVRALCASARLVAVGGTRAAAASQITVYDAAGKATHSFFGKLSGAEWGELMYKHIDHHLQQFGA